MSQYDKKYPSDKKFLGREQSDSRSQGANGNVSNDRYSSFGERSPRPYADKSQSDRNPFSKPFRAQSDNRSFRSESFSDRTQQSDFSRPLRSDRNESYS